MSLHVLIIPSEEFVPPESHLAGIFQFHQARALQDAGVKIGALSIKQVFSIPMLLKGALARALGRPASPKLPPGSPWSLLRLMMRKRFRLREFVRQESVEGVAVTRIEGGYDWKPKESSDYHAWCRAGEVACSAYMERHGRPDMLHAHNALYGGILAAKLAAKHGLPYVLTEHSSFVARRSVAESLLRRAAACYRSAAALLVVSPSLGQHLEAGGVIPAGGWRWVPNMIDPELVRIPLGQRRRAGAHRILTVGNLIPIKDHGTLLRAFAVLPGHETMELIIAGDGTEEHVLRALARSLGIARQTVFTGRLGRAALLEELDKASCLVLPSEFETFGVVLIESLARGVPVVASRCGGPECIVNESNGRLFAVGDVAGLQLALTEVLDHLDQFEPEALRADAMARFGPEHLSNVLQDIYHQALQKGAVS